MNFLRKKMYHPDWTLSFGERQSYYWYLMGQNVFYNLITMFLITYLAMSGVDPLKSSVVVLIVKVWDAVNDIFFGGLFDLVKFKKLKGKFMPWIRISVGIIPVISALLFLAPTQSSETVKLIWFAVFYILWDSVYTLCDTPIYGMVTTLTANFDERSALMSYARIFAYAGMGFAQLLGTVFISRYVGLSYGLTAIILSVCGFVFMLPLSIIGKEYNYNAESNDEKFTFKQILQYLPKNRYLLLYFLSYIILGALSTQNSIGLLVSFYLFDNEMFSLILGIIATVPSLIASLLVPVIIKKMDKYHLFVICSITVTVMSFIIYFVGYSNVWIYIALNTIRAIPGGIIAITQFMFTPDCAEYGRFKTGVDAKGITFSIQTFSSKLTAALNSALALFVLGLFGWISVEADSFEQLKEMYDLGIGMQTDLAIKGLWIVNALVPAIGNLLALIPLYFYKLRDKDVKIMTAVNAGEMTKEEGQALLGGRIK